MPREVIEYYDASTGLYVRHISEDVQPLIDSLAETRNHGNQRAFMKSGARWRKIGELPLIILDQWFREGFNAFDPSNEAELTRRLAGPYKKFMAVDKL